MLFRFKKYKLHILSRKITYLFLVFSLERRMESWSNLPHTPMIDYRPVPYHTTPTVDLLEWSGIITKANMSLFRKHLKTTSCIPPLASTNSNNGFIVHTTMRIAKNHHLSRHLLWRVWVEIKNLVLNPVCFSLLHYGCCNEIFFEKLYPLFIYLVFFN